MNTFNQSETIRKYLKENAGVRIYRDGIRVYNYGEPGNDWMGLDIGRTNNPSSKFSNNTILGAFSLDLKTSTGLQEKQIERDLMKMKYTNILKTYVIIL